MLLCDKDWLHKRGRRHLPGRLQQMRNCLLRALLLSPLSGKACRGHRELPRSSAGLGCLQKWWQQVFHTPGELTCGFSELSVNMLTVVLQILSWILCSCFCFSALFNASILGGWDILDFFHLCFSCSLAFALFSSSFSLFPFWPSLPVGAGAVSHSWCCA